MLRSSASVIYQSHAMAGKKKKRFRKHDKHRLLAEGRNEKWVETPLKSFVINYTERLLDQTWAREERSIGLFYLLLFCLPLSGFAVFRQLC